MQNASTIALVLGACIGASALCNTQALAASENKSSIMYQGGKQKYDRKIEAAAIKRVAAKIGEIRGSITNDDTSHIISNEEINNPQSSQLGFPIIEENGVDEDTVTGSVHIL